MGVQSGEVVSAPGYVIANHQGTLDQVWEAARTVMASMKAVRVSEEKKIAEGEDYRLHQCRKSGDRSPLRGSRHLGSGDPGGVGGSRLASEYIHEKIAAQLKSSSSRKVAQ